MEWPVMVVLIHIIKSNSGKVNQEIRGWVLKNMMWRRRLRRLIQALWFFSMVLVDCLTGFEMDLSMAELDEFEYINQLNVHGVLKELELENMENDNGVAVDNGE
ncbi:hypothetical protein C5167_048060 [Papaver somniferum]|uniref:Uncharacterized protein n=1 Tax=Papaver somniferum TaxID=3469 RepID=A0A4Y7KKU9_PAPSO|nr:hypothetical protein C5167_048060 [Papaver somniferum]